MKKPLDGLPANDDHGDDHADDAPPPPGNDWVRFDFKPGSTPEEIARILMEWKATHPPQDKPADA
jgi:hypothetical protein